jgi:lauroyl/myristoyl acyltransferase
MGDTIQKDVVYSSQPEAAAESTASKAGTITHKARKQKATPGWSLDDVSTMVSLALLWAPAWLLPEQLWSPLCRARIGLGALTGESAIKRTAKSLGAALGERDAARCLAIMREQKAAVHEMRLQDLRGWRPGGWSPQMRVEGEEHLQAALQGGKGAILWLAPFVFNSGPTKIALHQKGYRVSHLSSPKHGVSETRFGIKYLNRIRCIPEDRYLVDRIVFDRHAPTTAMRRMLRALKAGEVVSIVAASTEGYEMIQVPVFGGRLPVAVGAPRLAGLTGAPLLPAFTIRDPKLGWRIAIEPPIPLAAGASSEERCIAAATEFLRRSEPWVRQFPGQWRAWSKWRPD